MADGSSTTNESRYSTTNNFSFMYQVYCPYMLIYRNADRTPGFLSPAVLQKGLRVLIRKYYPPVAGWYDVHGDDIDVVYYKDKFNDPPFETQTLDIDYQTLRQRVVDSDEDLLVPKGPSATLTADNKDIPMFLVKATYLKSNEAVVLGVNYHHSLMDGAAIWLFLNNWAYVCRQVCEGSDEYSIPYPPTFGFPDISHLRDPSASFNHTEYVLVEQGNCAREFKPGTDPIREIIFIISPEQQLDIRSLAKECKVTFTAMLCAMFWKEISDVRFAARPSIGSDPSLFTCAVNPRSRLGISSNLCASPVVNVALVKPVSEIAKLELRDVAQLVEQTISKGSSAYICSSLDHLLSQRAKELEDEKQGRASQRAMFAYIQPASAKCTVSSSRNFPIYDVDFGFGRPNYVRPPYLPFDGCLRIWPAPPHRAYRDGSDNSAGSLEIYVSQPDHVDLSTSQLLSQFLASRADL
ncbi:hypothetical protein GQ54DRAFT_59605 [Martensiomyces pterosporus]|nr:hypothetical protein GQ54DRAFT_59605 [Martensiomyces pterosporus]